LWVCTVVTVTVVTVKDSPRSSTQITIFGFESGKILHMKM